MNLSGRLFADDVTGKLQTRKLQTREYAENILIAQQYAVF